MEGVSLENGKGPKETAQLQLPNIKENRRDFVKLNKQLVKLVWWLRPE